MHDKQLFLFFDFFNSFNLSSQVVHIDLEPKFVIFGSLESKKPPQQRKEKKRKKKKNTPRF
jgi:hypothetical protein